MLKPQHEVDEYAILQQHNIGLRVIGKCYNLSHNTIRNRLKENDLNKPKRKFDTKLTIRRQKHNSHISLSEVTHFIDGYRINNNSIRRLHHSRKTIDNSPLLLALCNRKEVLHYEVFSVCKETQQKYSILIDNALKRGIKLRVVCMDRVYKKLIKRLQKLNIEVVVYGKTTIRPYNTQIERQFANMSKTLYGDMAFIETLNKEDLREYFLGLCEVFFYYKQNRLLSFLQKREIETLKIMVRQKL